MGTREKLEDAYRIALAAFADAESKLMRKVSGNITGKWIDQDKVSANGRKGTGARGRPKSDDSVVVFKSRRS